MPIQSCRLSAQSLLFAGLSLIVACGSADGAPPGSSSSCLKDTDCKGERLCVSGECVDPQAAKGAGGSQAANVARDPYVGGMAGAPTVTTGGSAGSGAAQTMAASPLSCSGSKEVSCLAINPRGETTVDGVYLHHEQIRETTAWTLLSGDGIFAFYLLEKPMTGDYQVEPYSSSDTEEGVFASVPVSLKGVHVSLRDPAHSSLDHYLASSGTIHMNVEGSLLIADWEDIEVHSAERVSNFTGGRSQGHIVFHEDSQTVSMGAAGGSN